MLLNKGNFPFNSVYCISLPESISRRNHIEDELGRNNIVNYEFIDAVGKNNAIVEDAYNSGMVKLFPPCFRCGKDKCLCENNVLIETQVATFFSHKKVWEIIAANKDGIYLIIEDDIKFNWYYKFIKYFFQNKIHSLINECKNSPLLIRLAWAQNAEHRLSTVKLIEGLVKMSNPMYSINPEMAKVLIEEFKTIDTTVDVYVHNNIGVKYKNYTLMPPLAHELSYSHGKVESLVRPREKRIKRLQKQNVENAKKELNNYDCHIDKAIVKKILVIGHPRTGSGYISELLKAYGLDVGHEEMGEDGIVSWMFSVYDLNNPFYLNKYARSRYFASFENIIMFARDPLTAIPSIIRENSASKISLAFRVKHIKKNYKINIQEIEDHLEKAIEIYYLWSKLVIENNRPSLVVRIEYDDDILFDFLKRQGLNVVVNSDELPSKEVNSNKKYKGKNIEKPKIDFNMWLGLDDNYK